MYVYHRHVASLLLLTAGLLLSLPSRAWVETSIRSHMATVDVERDGRAVVTHRILMHVRGGPLEGFELAGIDGDAEPLSDATVSAAKSGRGGEATIPLSLEKLEGDRLSVRIDKGLRRGLYLFELGYRTNLMARDRMKRTGDVVELSWVGPRLSQGVDSVKALFRIPKASQPPRLSQVDLEQAALGLDESPSGVFVSSLHRALDKDESLEVVRVRVAKNEAVKWRIAVSPDALDAFAAPRDLVTPSPPPVGEEKNAHLSWIGLLSGLCYALVVWLKHRCVERACRLRRAVPRRLVRLPPVARAALSGALLAGAVTVGLLWAQPLASAVLLLLSMLLAAHLTPHVRPRLRGPGEWKRVPDLATLPEEPAPAGRWLDSGSSPGFFLFAMCLGAFAALALDLLETSRHDAMLAAITSACLLPIFCTGRASELPRDPVAGARKPLFWMLEKLTRQGYDAALIGRFPHGADVPDGGRLHALPERPMAGLLGMEVGLEYQQGGGGPLALPCVLVRVIDRSAAQAALGRSVAWLRGRTPEERVAVIRPAIPSRGQCLALVRRLAGLLRVRAREVPHSTERKKARPPSASRVPCRTPQARPEPVL